MQRVRTAVVYQPTGNAVAGAPTPEAAPTGGPAGLFAQVETALKNTFNTQAPGQRNDWKEIEGAWVLYPPLERAPTAVVHFMGGAIVGAAPQLSYRLFLEALSNRDVLVIATPYSMSFDQLRIADESQFMFDRALRTLGPEITSLPIYGVGHSMGALLHLLISSRYAVARAGNAFLAYNNLSAHSVIPFLAPIVGPSARLLNPLLSTVASLPARNAVEGVLEAVRDLTPSLLRQLSAVAAQFPALYVDASQGHDEFSPSPEDTAALIRTYYAVPRNLLLRFKDDSLDETNTLALTLQGSPAVSQMLDLSVRTLPGDHLRPMQQALVDLPPDVARLANQAVYAGGDAIGRLAEVAGQLGVSSAMAPLKDLSKGVAGLADLFGGEVGGPVTDGMQALADEVAAWMGTGGAVISGSRALPARSVYTDRPQFRTTASPAPSRSGRTPTPARSRRSTTPAPLR